MSEDIISAKNKFERFFQTVGLHGEGKWIIYGILIGVISAIGAWIFFLCLTWAQFFLQSGLAGYQVLEAYGEQIVDFSVDTPFKPWLFFILPVLGGLVSGWLVYRFAPEAEGHGTDAMIDAFHNKKGVIRARVPLVKSIATIVTMATGGSAGREGPIAQIGAGLGSLTAKFFGLNARERRIMLLMGTGGGLGAIFRSPLGGAVTAVEVLYREDLEASALVPTIISSVTAYAVFSSIFGFHYIFQVPQFKFDNPWEIFAYALLALIMTPLGFFYTKFFYAMRDFFKALKIPRTLKPALGGLLVGCVGLAYPQVYSSGYGFLQRAILGELGGDFKSVAVFMLALAFFKILATSFTIGSGGSGGVFGPTLFIGGMFGGALGLVGHHFLPHLITQPGAYVIVGMAAFFAGVAKAPLGSILMTMEMTGGYGLIAPLLLVSVLSMILMEKWSIYEKQVPTRLQSPAHLNDYTVNVLKDMTVDDIFQPAEEITCLSKNATLGDVKRIIAESSSNAFPVLDDAGNFVGVFNPQKAISGMMDNMLDDLVIVSDICEQAPLIDLQESLYDALLKLTTSNQTQLPVVSPDDPNKIIGFITQDALIRTYRNEMDRLKDTDQAIRPSKKKK